MAIKQIAARLPADLVAAVKIAAIKHNTSLQAFVEAALRAQLKASK